MQKVSKNIGRVLCLVLCILFYDVSIPSSHAFLATQCRVLSVNSSAWVTPQRSSVKQTIAQGLMLNNWDVIEVLAGHTIDLTFDQANKNVMHVVGPSKIRINMGRVIQIKLDKGQVFALLNDLPALDVDEFEVITPAAVSSVRGTAFQIASTLQGTRAILYDGSMRIEGRSLAGKTIFGAVYLKPAHMTIIKEPDRMPSRPVLISRNIFEEINRIIRQFFGAKEPLDYSVATLGLSLENVNNEANESILVRQYNPDRLNDAPTDIDSDRRDTGDKYFF